MKRGRVGPRTLDDLRAGEAAELRPPIFPKARVARARGHGSSGPRTRVHLVPKGDVRDDKSLSDRSTLPSLGLGRRRVTGGRILRDTLLHALEDRVEFCV